MCRHLAHLGHAVSLEELLVEPPFGLLRQSYAPRRQAHGLMNADGFGVGWYDPVRPEPARYRRAVPMWADRSFASLAGVVRSVCVLAAVRSTTVGGPPDESAAAPFLLRGQVLLSHNGRARVDAVAPLVDAVDLAAIGSTVDSAYLAALVSARLDAGLREALSSVVREVGFLDAGARLNLLATDGESVVATTWGDTLTTRTTDRGVVVASEASDDGPGWMDVPDRTLVTVTSSGLTLEDL
jgi:glutamine amidotransferase